MPLFVLYLVLPDQVMALFGVEFQQGAFALVVLVLGSLVNVATGPVATLLNMANYETIVLRIQIAEAGLNAVLLVLLVPPFGVLGAAVATTFGTAFCT